MSCPRHGMAQGAHSSSVLHSRGGLGTAGRRCRRRIGRRCRDGGIVRDSALSPRFAARDDIRGGAAPVRFRSGRWQPALVVDAWAHNACRDGHIASASSRGASAGAGAAEGATCSLDVAEDVAKIEEPVGNARSLKKIIPLGIIFFFSVPFLAFN